MSVTCWMHKKRNSGDTSLDAFERSTITHCTVFPVSFPLVSSVRRPLCWQLPAWAWSSFRYCFSTCRILARKTRHLLIVNLHNSLFADMPVGFSSKMSWRRGRKSFDFFLPFIRLITGEPCSRVKRDSGRYRAISDDVPFCFAPMPNGCSRFWVPADLQPENTGSAWPSPRSL